MNSPLSQAQIHEIMEETKDETSPRNRARKVLQTWLGNLVDATRNGADPFTLRSLEFAAVQAIIAEYRSAEAALGAVVSPEAAGDDRGGDFDVEAYDRDRAACLAGEGER